MTDTPSITELAKAAELVKQLKEGCALSDPANEFDNSVDVDAADELMNEAADLILSLTSRVEMLEGALKPFADEAEDWAPTKPDSFVPLSVHYTVGDLRRAARTISTGAKP